MTNPYSAFVLIFLSFVGLARPHAVEGSTPIQKKRVPDADPQMIVRLIAAAKEDNKFWASVQALAEEGTPAIGQLFTALNDEVPEVRWAAVDALAMMRTADPRTLDPLIAALKDDDTNVRRTAATALGNTQDPRAVESLISALTDSEWEVRCMAIESLRKIAPPRAVEPLIFALKEKEHAVRESAANALIAIGTPAIKRLATALNDKDKLIRYGAARCLAAMPETEEIRKLNSTKDLRVVAAAYAYFIEKATLGTEEVLIDALNTYLIRKILQPNQIPTIIRRILTQTKPPKRNCHGHEPNPIPTRIVLACIPCAVWHRRAMRGCIGSVTLAARLPLPGVRRRGLLFAQGREA